jgi:hypothetical protein
MRYVICPSSNKPRNISGILSSFPAHPRHTTGPRTLEERFHQLEAKNVRLRQLTATPLSNGTPQASTTTGINVGLGDMRGVNDVMNGDAMTNDDMNVDPNLRSTVYMSCMHTSATYLLSKMPLNSCNYKLKVELDIACFICSRKRRQQPQECITMLNSITRTSLHSDSVSHQLPSGTPSSIITMQQLVQLSQVIISQLDQQRKQLSWTQRRALTSLKRSLNQYIMQL